MRFQQSQRHGRLHPLPLVANTMSNDLVCGKGELMFDWHASFGRILNRIIVTFSLHAFFQVINRTTTHLSLWITWITSLWNICRTIWLGHCINTWSGHQGSVDMCVKNHSQASCDALNCFVRCSTHNTIVGWKIEIKIYSKILKQSIPSP